MALTGQDILNSVNKAPLPQKVAVIVFIVAGLTIGNWFLLISPNLDLIAARTAEQRKLEDELIQKQSIANNLAMFKREKEILERKLAQALTELPNEANIEELIRSFGDIAQKSGLTINVIEPQAEQRQSFYAAIPIVMSVSGNYHEIAVFLDSLAKLARIVNVTNIKLTSPKMSGEKLTVNASYVATTFRFVEAKKP